MRKFNPSWPAMALACASLFMALGGPAWAAGLISGSQIKNGSITSNKIGRGQVKATNLATGAVTGSKVARGSLTAADVAAGTFLAANGTATNSAQLGGVPASGYLTANGTAANSAQLGGVPASAYLTANGTAANSAQLGGVPADRFVQGTGNMLQHRIEVPAGTSDQLLLDVGLGEFDASCVSGSPVKPEVSFVAEAQPLNFVEWGTTSPSSPDINTLNGLAIGSGYTEPNASGLPQAIDFQLAQSGEGINRVATVWTTDQEIGGSACIFTAQALTTGT